MMVAKVGSSSAVDSYGNELPDITKLVGQASQSEADLGMRIVKAQYQMSAQEEKMETIEDALGQLLS